MIHNKIHTITMATLTFLLALTVPIRSQSHDMMPIVVEADRIRIGAEFIPRRLDLPLVKQVTTAFEFPADSTWDYIEVLPGAKASCSPTIHTIIRFTTIVVIPGGTFECGTEAAPASFELIVRSVPIDTARDPFQWGNGIVNFGTMIRVAKTKTARLTTGDLFKGATTIVLDEPPVGWAANDELLIPDMQQQPLRFEFSRPRRETPVFIAGISDRTVMLSKPLDFDHISIHKPKAPGQTTGDVVVTPRVLNVTRDGVVRSESQGVPGHTANVGAAARWTIRSNLLIGIGRTTVAPLDNTTADAAGNITHIGIRQVGRYTEHDHHTCFQKASFEACESINNVYRGVPNGDPACADCYNLGSKWAKVTHGTHDTRIENNIALDFPGAGYVTEDGYEVRNHYLGNTAAYILAPHYYAADGSGISLFFPPTNITENHPGTEGTGIWARGTGNYYDRNEVFNSTVGINLFNQSQVPGMWPSQVDGPLDTIFDALFASRQRMAPRQFTDNVFVGNVTGIDLWALPPFDNLRSISANNVAAALNAQISEAHRPVLKQPVFVNQDGLGFGLNADGAYLELLRVEGGYVGGFEFCLPRGGGVTATEFVGTTFQCIENLRFVDVQPLALVHDSVIHLPYENYPPRYIVMNGDIWNGATEEHTSELGFMAYSPTRGSQFVLTNWQGTGKTYRIGQNQQRSTLPAWGSANNWSSDVFNPPESGLTFEQVWTKYGMGFRGDTFRPSEIVMLPGLLNGFAREGLALAFGPPQGVLTFPTMRAAAVLEYDEYLRFYAMVSGDPAQTNPILKVVVDGTTTFLLDQDPNRGPLDGRRFVLERRLHAQHMTPGTHEVRTWRFDPAGILMPTTEHVWHYYFNEPGSPVDVCPNITGAQSTVPAGMVLINGQCVDAPPPPTCQAPNVLVDGICVAPPPVCQLPSVLVNGQCVTPPPPPPPPPPVETKRPVIGGVLQLFIDEVAQNRFFLCPTPTTCVELVIK